MLLGSFFSWCLFLAGLLLMTVVLMRRWLRYYGWRGRGGRRERLSAAGPQRESGPSDTLRLVDAPPEILRWSVEMQETARDLKAELDSKIGVLQALVQLARLEADRLEALVQQGQEVNG